MNHEKPPLSTIGDRVKKLRKELGLTQEKLAKSAGIAQSTLNGIETGSRNKAPSSIIEIAHALGVDAYWLKHGGDPAEQILTNKNKATFDTETVSGRIKFAREKLNNISQTELAKRAGISQSFIGALESSNQHNSKYIPEIAHALGVSAFWLKTGKDDPGALKHKNQHAIGKQCESDIDQRILSLLHLMPSDEKMAMMAMLDIRFSRPDHPHQSTSTKTNKQQK